MTIPQRAEAMLARLLDTARKAGIDDDGAAGIERAYRAAMAPRAARLEDDHAPAFLHPGRTALILMDDLGVADPDVVAAGALAETIFPELAADVAGIDRDVAAILRELPVPARDGERLLERLVSAPDAVRLVALAERLDHARHLHLEPDLDWPAFHHETCAIYAPVAERIHPTLARRFAWWCRTFDRRFLRGDGG